MQKPSNEKPMRSSVKRRVRIAAIVAALACAAVLLVVAQSWAIGSFATQANDAEQSATEQNAQDVQNGQGAATGKEGSGQDSSTGNFQNLKTKANVTVGNFVYEIDTETKTATLTDYKGSAPENFIIPSTFVFTSGSTSDTYTVTAIDRVGISGTKSTTIPATVTTISSGAFDSPLEGGPDFYFLGNAPSCDEPYALWGGAALADNTDGTIYYLEGNKSSFST